MDVFKVILPYAGIFLAIISILNLIKINVRKNWLSTSGRVTQSTAELEIDTFHNVRSKQKPLNTYSFKWYKPKLRYEYEVNGNRYEGHNIFSAPLAPPRMNDILMITDGSLQTVWYSPKNPRKSYIIQSSTIPSVMLLILAMVFVGYSFNPESFNGLVGEICNKLQNS